MPDTGDFQVARKISALFRGALGFAVGVDVVVAAIDASGLWLIRRAAPT